MSQAFLFSEIRDNRDGSVQTVFAKTLEPVSNKNYKNDIGNSYLRNYDPMVIPPDAKANK